MACEHSRLPGHRRHDHPAAKGDQHAAPGRARRHLQRHHLQEDRARCHPRAIICAGSDCYGSFDGCSFSGCSVYAVHGAAVAFSRCRVTLAGPGIVASGADTSVTLRRCQIMDCPTAIIVEGGAAVRAAACYVDSMFACVCVNDSSSRFDVSRALRQQRGGGGECVVALGGGGAVTATHLVAHGGTHGVKVLSRGGGDTAVKLKRRQFIGLTAGVELGGCRR
eukprot:jgi/Ulvmu1/9463/UM052_0031.1